MEKKCRERGVELKRRSWSRGGENLHPDREQEAAIVPKDAMPRKASAEGLAKKPKAAKEEASYYKHKSAYLEALTQVR